MIDTKDVSLKSFIYKAYDMSASLKEEMSFWSWTEQIEPISLLSLFESAKNKQRTFWTNSVRDFSFVGIGCVHQLTADENRYEMLKNQWNELLQRTFIYNPYEVGGTGFVAVGGMTFDPERGRGKLWEEFPSSELIIPELLVVKRAGKFYLTINQMLRQEESIQDTVFRVTKLKQIIDNQVTVEEGGHRVIKKEEIAPKRWKTIVKEAVNEIKAGHAKKIVLAREMKLTLDQSANITSLLNRLLQTQTNSYVFAFEKGEACFIGATPERLVEVHGNRLLSTCIAGTAPRGKTEEDDRKIGEQLLHDEKNREEHDYVVQMIKQNIERYCENISIPNQPILHPLKDLQHLYTPVEATLKKNISIFDIVEKLHPTPALGGVPREKSLAFIRNNEVLERGWYGAPFGWLDSNKQGEFIVAIRSGLLKGEDVSLFAGCGVMRDSDPMMEFEETRVKFLPMLNVLEENNESY